MRMRTLDHPMILTTLIKLPMSYLLLDLQVDFENIIQYKYVNFDLEK